MIMNWNNWLYADRLGEEKQTPKPQTNADRIRAMSDEQLAEIVHAIYLAEDCPFSSADCETCLFQKICNGNYKTESEWLKQPAE
jgi:hypothetical protein